MPRVVERRLAGEDRDPRPSLTSERGAASARHAPRVQEGNRRNDRSVSLEHTWPTFLTMSVMPVPGPHPLRLAEAQATISRAPHQTT